MRHVLLVLILLFVYTRMVGQDAEPSFVGHNYTPERIAVMKSSLALHEAEGNIFWPLYNQYEEKARKNSECTFITLNQLTSSDLSHNASHCVETILKTQFDEVSLKKEYFNQIDKALNANIGLQFLQSEALLDLLLKSKLYEKLTWHRPQWNEAMFKDEEVKLSVLEFTLGIPAEKSATFRTLFEDYEFEFSRVVGHQLVWFEQYIEDASELSPGQCQKLGNEFIIMQHNEVRVKEKFFQLMQNSFGPELAARFLALQDYFTMMAKLKVWSENEYAVR